ncbi:MAG: peptidoglycan/xylan/chitin deacetylase (PgdA/CDA1 family) [Candidatus Marinamargulisbacteria bacterium]|jgi:peptidoglycan/xylan/chitin deacetylase (PgdA/CDA1 family)
MKSLIKRGLGGALSCRVFDTWLERLFKSRKVILNFHYVGESVSYYESFFGGLTLRRFDEQLTLLSHYFDFVPLSRILENEVSNKPVLAITFDDGFNLIRSGVKDILEKHQAYATTFVIGSCLNNQSLMWRNKISAMKAIKGEVALVQVFNDIAHVFNCHPVGSFSELLHRSLFWRVEDIHPILDVVWARLELPLLKEYLRQEAPYFTIEELQDWVSAGHEVGCHTYSHFSARALGAGQIETEYLQPARDLCGIFSKEVIPFSYPFGVRFEGLMDEQLRMSRLFSTLLGVGGFSREDTSVFDLERLSADALFDRDLVFGLVKNAWSAL